MDGIVFDFATSADLDAIAQLASASLLKTEAPSKTGFLVSKYTRADYEIYLRDQLDEKKRHRNRKTTWLLVAKSSDGFLGFMLAFLGDYATKLPGSEGLRFANRESAHTILDMLGKHVPFVIIKQICIDPKHRKAGIGRDFYNYFYSELCPEQVTHSFAAIVADPENSPSEEFHKVMGFARTLQSRSRQCGSAATYLNFIWHRPVKPHFVSTNSHRTLDREISSIRDGRNEAQKLYLHEDNLNWRKNSFLIVLLFAQIAAESAIINRWVSNPSLPAFYLTLTAIAGTIGMLSVWLCSDMIKSGRLFMASHKATTKILEAQLAIKDPGYLAPVWVVPTVSKSVTIIGMLTTIAKTISIIVALGPIFFYAILKMAQWAS
jgi:hypothetical protein